VIRRIAAAILPPVLLVVPYLNWQIGCCSGSAPGTDLLVPMAGFVRRH